MSKPIRVIQYGIGPIGLEVARAVIKKQSSGMVELVGAVDIDPDKIGRDLGDLLGTPETGVRVSGDIEAVLQNTRPDVVLHTTSSFMDKVIDQLLLCVRAGVHVVSSTEELSYPFDRSPDLSRKLEDACREHSVAVIGTGVNPGYAMDVLAVAATGVCLDVDRIEVERVVNAGLRRGPLQMKVGAGLTARQFEEKKATGRFGHIGMRESMLLVADALGWKPDRITETLEPVFATERIQTNVVTVEPGQVTGIHQEVIAYVGEVPAIRLDLRMAVSERVSSDRVRVHGRPPVNFHVEGGIFGDSATVASVINSIPIVVSAEPGIRKVTDLPVPRAFAVEPSI